MSIPHVRMLPIALVSALLIGGCLADNTTSGPTTSSAPQLSDQAGTPQGQPGYEPAYYNGNVYTINAIEVPNHAPMQAQADFYEVVYPIGWQSLGVPPPQCNPCDHQGNGIDPTDFHDHVLDSIPGDPGHGNYRALWHVYLIMPNYTGDPAHDAAVSAAYATYLPATSETAIDALLATAGPGGAPLAIKIDTDFYFLCAVVGQGHSRN
jgi:hypothetical protein